MNILDEDIALSRERRGNQFYPIRPMMQIDESDFRSLTEFPLNWRWTDSQWAKLPDDVLRDIQPLVEAKACECAQHSSKFYNQLDPDDAISGRAASLDSSADEVAVRQWLRERCSGLTERVVVSWDKRLAICVSWGVFCHH